MAQTLKRGTLKSLTDIQRQMTRLYRENRRGDLDNTSLTTLSQHLTRLHNMMVAEREIDVTEELAAIEEKLLQIQSR